MRGGVCCILLMMGSSDADIALTEVGGFPSNFLKISDEMRSSIFSPCMQDMIQHVSEIMLA